MLETVIVALWVMIPAYVPNSLAVVAGGGKPIDGGEKIGERRVLGDGKTWRGTVVGTVGGVSTALILNQLVPMVKDLGFEVEPFTLYVAFGLAFGSMLGDICASFLKRRTGRERGSSFILVDQLDFVAGSLILSFILDSGWITDILGLMSLAVILVLTPIIHVSANVIAYGLGLKKEPY